MLDHNNIIQSDELKSIYFTHQDTVITYNGEIYTCDFESQSIDKIDALIKNTLNY
uniref:Exonuclease sbcC n=1 Tax=Aliivibrio fischeri TaxID=668 RepID=H2ERX3_ALIFS|nr:exonuclease sbcC [Aliivibrio fischeri]